MYGVVICLSLLFWLGLLFLIFVGSLVLRLLDLRRNLIILFDFWFALVEFLSLAWYIIFFVILVAWFFWLSHACKPSYLGRPWRFDSRVNNLVIVIICIVLEVIVLNCLPVEQFFYLSLVKLVWAPVHNELAFVFVEHDHEDLLTTQHRNFHSFLDQSFLSFAIGNISRDTVLNEAHVWDLLLAHDCL